MQGIGIVAFLHQLICNFLCLFTGAAEDDTINLRIIVDDAFQCFEFIFGLYSVSDVLHIAGTFVLATDRNFLRITQVFFRNACNFRTHGCREQQGVAFLRNIR